MNLFCPKAVLEFFCSGFMGRSQTQFSKSLKRPNQDPQNHPLTATSRSILFEGFCVSHSHPQAPRGCLYRRFRETGKRLALLVRVVASNGKNATIFFIHGRIPPKSINGSTEWPCHFRSGLFGFQLPATHAPQPAV